MVETTSNPAIANSDEIDLYELLIKIILFFRKHIKIFIVAIVIGLVVGIGLSLLLKKQYYRAYLIANTSLSDEDVMEVVKSIKYSVEKQNYNSFEKKLNISQGDSIRIKKIDIENVLIASGWDIDGKVTSLVKSKLFKITIDFSKKSYKESIQDQQPFLDTMRNGIVNYINNNPYIKERQTYAKIAINNMIGEIGNQLKKLDTLQKSVIEQKPQHGQVVVENANKQSFSSDILALLEKKLRLEESYQLDKPIMIVEDFNCTVVTELGLSIKKIGLLCLAFFTLALIFVFVKEIPGINKNEVSKT